MSETSRDSTCCPGKSVYAKGLCRSCYERDLRLKNPEYAERQRENAQEWRKKNPDLVREKAKKRAKDESYKEKRRWQALERTYGITKEKYFELLEIQGGGCAICGRGIESGSSKLAVDHDHESGQIRGLLCFRCNYGLSWFQENPRLLGRAAVYLHFHPCEEGLVVNG